jgi:hypothetical protein
MAVAADVWRQAVIALRHWKVWIVLVVLIPFGASEVRTAEDPPAREPEDSAPKDDLAKERQKYILRAMKKYEVVVDEDHDKRATLAETALLRWSNPLGDVDDGLMSVYSLGPKERPSMIAHFYLHGPALNGLEMQEFADIHPGKVELFRGERKVWSPATRYSKFETLPGAPKPSDNPAVRLSQIKTMAARFEIIDGFRETNRQPRPYVLRMMSRPTYRYGRPDVEILDGAMFTYVVSTDPEACLLIEIRRKDNVTSWHYMIAPMTIYSLDAKLDGKNVWTKPEAFVFGDSTAPHYISSYHGDPGEEPLKTLAPSSRSDEKSK